MKTIKVKFLGHPVEYPFGYSHFLYEELSKFTSIEISENPDYVFFCDTSYEHYKYPDAIKIFYTGENISPNFNECDYAISFDYIHFEDRHFRLPLYLVTSFYTQEEKDEVGKNYLSKNYKYGTKELEKKDGFCSFVYSNYRAGKERRQIYELLSSYKDVSSSGSYLNTTGERIKNKLRFEQKHKFSVAFENSSRSGYTTEKIVGSLMASAIPIYWGNPRISEEFNSERFINCHDFASFETVLERIKEIDNDDDLYLSIVNKPLLNPKYNPEKVMADFGTFLTSIINQPKEEARRRTINPVKKEETDSYGRIIFYYVYSFHYAKQFLARLYKPFKKIKILETIKHSLFAQK